jgi:hypothetical protein
MVAKFNGVWVCWAKFNVRGSGLALLQWYVTS